MAPSLWQLLVVLVIALLLFGGRGKISSIMGDFGKGLRSFKKSMKDDDDTTADASSKEIETEATARTEEATPKKDKAANV